MARTASRCPRCRTSWSCCSPAAVSRWSTVVERSPRSFESVGALTAFLRRQLFIAEGGEKDVHFRAILPDHISRRDGAWTLSDPPQGSLGIVTWRMEPARA